MTGLNNCRKPYVCAGATSKGAAEEELENLNNLELLNFYMFLIMFPPDSEAPCKLWRNVTETR